MFKKFTKYWQKNLNINFVSNIWVLDVMVA